MRIACLGWGSLTWDSRELNIPKEKWNEDGPALPIEFSRISNDGRVTLIIDEKAELQTILWVELEQKELNEARCLLARREGTKFEKISYINANADINKENKIESNIVNWLNIKKLDVAIWTGLSYKNNMRPTEDQIIEHLGNLEDCDKERAEEYIRKAPVQINTAYRRRMVKEFGWTSK